MHVCVCVCACARVRVHVCVRARVCAACARVLFWSWALDVRVHGYLSSLDRLKTLCVKASQEKLVFAMQGLEHIIAHRPLSSSFLGLPYRILNIKHKKELLRGLWVGFRYTF